MNTVEKSAISWPVTKLASSEQRNAITAATSSGRPGRPSGTFAIDASRKRRIAAGSGVHVSEVNRLLKNYLQMQKMMKTMSKGGGLRRLMGAFGGGPPKF